MANVHKLYKNLFVFLNVDFLNGKGTLVVLFKTKRWTYLTAGMFSNILIAVNKEVAFDNVAPILTLGLGGGIYGDLLACS